MSEWEKYRKQAKDPDKFDWKAKQAFPASEPLLRRAASSLNQSASRRASAASHVPKGVRAGRPSKGDRNDSR